MTEVETYVRTLVLRVVHDLAIPSGFLRREQVVDALTKQFRQLLKRHGAAQLIDLPAFVDKFVDELIAENILVDERHDIAGSYYIFQKGRFTFFQQKALARNEIAAAADRIGERFFGDVFTAFARDTTREAASRPLPPLGLPLSQAKVARFSDKQADTTIAALDKLIAALSDDPRLSASPDLVQLIAGQLEAGRALLARRVVRLHLLKAVLGEALAWLAGGAETTPVGSLAAAIDKSLSNHSIISG